MAHELDKYIPAAEAVAALLRPHAEVVLHDLTTGKIHAIINPLSRRSAGESSRTEVEIARALDMSVIGPYRKTNWDRRQLRSVTAVLRNPAQVPIGLMCINLDITVFEGAVSFLRQLIEFSPEPVLKTELFKPDWKEIASAVLRSYMANHRLTEAAITRKDHREILRQLDEAGIFHMRGSMPYVTQMLGISRSTIYNILNKIRKSPHTL